MAKLKNVIGRHIIVLLYYILRVFPINKRKVFVQNFYGRGYGDSPKYIIDYLLRNYSGYDVVWCVKGEEVFPSGIRTVNINGLMGLLKSIYEQTTAKVWIDNCPKYHFERKRRKQYYIQTFHGDIGNKKSGGDAAKSNSDYVKNTKHDSQMADLFVCGNEWMCQRYREAFWYNGEIATCGLPRRDILYNSTEQQRLKIRERLRVPKEMKLLLYVPTFRNEDIFNHRLGNYVTLFDWSSILKAMKDRFGGEWCGLIRLHPNVAKYSKDLILPPNVFDVTSYPDVNELCCISDGCISDYSSTLFEFAITKNPGFIFAPDKNDYEDERGYYFTDDEIPFTVATEVNSLIQDIQNFDEYDYLEKFKKFYNDTIHMYPEGHASEYLVHRIVEVCK